MKEILKSKMMILFITLVLGVTYFSSLSTERMEDQNTDEYQNIVVANMK